MHSCDFVLHYDVGVIWVWYNVFNTITNMTRLLLFIFTLNFIFANSTPLHLIFQPHLTPNIVAQTDFGVFALGSFFDRGGTLRAEGTTLDWRSVDIDLEGGICVV